MGYVLLLCCIPLVMFTVVLISEIIGTKEYTFSEKVALIMLLLFFPVIGLFCYVHIKNGQSGESEELPPYQNPPAYTVDIQLETPRRASI